MKVLSFRYSSLLSFCVSQNKNNYHYSRAMSAVTNSNNDNNNNAAAAAATTANNKQSSTSGTKRNIAAIAQLRSTSNKYENLKNVAICARLAKQQGASMLFLPECFGFLGESSDQTLEQADPPVSVETNNDSPTTNNNINNNNNNDSISQSLIDTIRGGEGNGETSNDATSPPPPPIITSDGTFIHLLDGLRTIARESGLWISGGGMHERDAPKDDETGGPRVYNTHVILDDQGIVRAVYRKMHLFDVSIPGKVQLRESKTTAPGTELVVCDSPIGKLGLTTCYDVRFPEMYIRLVQKGAQVLLVPSAFTVPTGAAHWHTLLRARAIESQCYVLAAAQYGKHNSKRESFGHTLAVDPWGRVVGDAGGYPLIFGPNDDEDTNNENDENIVEDPPSIITCEIDIDQIESVRQRIPIELHRSNAPISL